MEVLERLKAWIPSAIQRNASDRAFLPLDALCDDVGAFFRLTVKVLEGKIKLSQKQLNIGFDVVHQLLERKDDMPAARSGSSITDSVGILAKLIVSHCAEVISVLLGNGLVPSDETFDKIFDDDACSLDIETLYTGRSGSKSSCRILAESIAYSQGEQDKNVRDPIGDGLSQFADFRTQLRIIQVMWSLLPNERYAKEKRKVLENAFNSALFQERHGPKAELVKLFYNISRESFWMDSLLFLQKVDRVNDGKMTFPKIMNVEVKALSPNRSNNGDTLRSRALLAVHSREIVVHTEVSTIEGEDLRIPFESITRWDPAPKNADGPRATLLLIEWLESNESQSRIALDLGSDHDSVTDILVHHLTSLRKTPGRKTSVPESRLRLTRHADTVARAPDQELTTSEEAQNWRQESSDIDDEQPSPHRERFTHAVAAKVETKSKAENVIREANRMESNMSNVASMTRTKSSVASMKTPVKGRAKRSAKKGERRPQPKPLTTRMKPQNVARVSEQSEPKIHITDKTLSKQPAPPSALDASDYELRGMKSVSRASKAVLEEEEVGPERVMSSTPASTPAAKRTALADITTRDISPIPAKRVHLTTPESVRHSPAKSSPKNRFAIVPRGQLNPISYQRLNSDQSHKDDVSLLSSVDADTSISDLFEISRISSATAPTPQKPSPGVHKVLTSKDTERSPEAAIDDTIVALFQSLGELFVHKLQEKQTKVQAMCSKMAIASASDLQRLVSQQNLERQQWMTKQVTQWQ
ncbi:hypothetical protein BZG36_03802 [Bifiguratus adelaidae]|uniref:Uncharacterized protein n=1 Tax=Bifiguratus adelaidae TaxID=1938954 RepID=A0A261XWZ3_9FUNG|nr:hypothetical protein BZG36_03802 [Bifiguratus adelaidae]